MVSLGLNNIRESSVLLHRTQNLDRVSDAFWGMVSSLWVQTATQSFRQVLDHHQTEDFSQYADLLEHLSSTSANVVSSRSL